jgi:hypothetical protein
VEDHHAPVVREAGRRVNPGRRHFAREGLATTRSGLLGREGLATTRSLVGPGFEELADEEPRDELEERAAALATWSETWATSTITPAT